MAKYTNKIKNVVGDIEPFLNIDQESKNVFLEDIVKLASDLSINEQLEIKLTNSSKLKAIHGLYDYPLSYIFFKCLYEAQILEKVTDNVPNISDLKIFIEWHRENIHNVDFNKIHKLMDELDPNNELYELNELLLVYRLMFKTSSHRNTLHNAMYNNRFIGVDVQHAIESVNLDYTEYLIGNRHKISLFVPENKTQPDIHTIAYIINFMDKLAIKYSKKTLKTPDVNLTIIYSDQKKIIHPNTKVICCDNVNSGSTYPGRFIVCWRREEFYKVLIHELFHYHKFDFYSSDEFYPQLNDLIKKNGFEEDELDMLNEAYTEACTVLILIVLKFVREHEDNNFITEFDKFFIDCLKLEIAFTQFQIAKIIVLFGGKSFDSLFKDNHNKIVIKQTTSFRSYFLFKLFILCNLDSLLKFIDKSLYVSGSRLIEFGELLNESVQFFINTKNVDIVNNFIKDIINAKQKNEWIYETCRMTANFL